MAYATSTGEQVWRLQHGAPVTTICLHPQDGSLLLSGSIDGHVTLWDLATGAPVRQWRVGSPIESLAVDMTGDTGGQGPSLTSLTSGVAVVGLLLPGQWRSPPGAPHQHMLFALPGPPHPVWQHTLVVTGGCGRQGGCSRSTCPVALPSLPAGVPKSQQPNASW